MSKSQARRALLRSNIQQNYEIEKASASSSQKGSMSTTQILKPKLTKRLDGLHPAQSRAESEVGHMPLESTVPLHS